MCNSGVRAIPDLVSAWLQRRTQEFCSVERVQQIAVEDRGQRERGSGGGSPLVRGSAKFANE
jgi:hypothetical protein